MTRRHLASDTIELASKFTDNDLEAIGKCSDTIVELANLKQLDVACFAASRACQMFYPTVHGQVVAR